MGKDSGVERMGDPGNQARSISGLALRVTLLVLCIVGRTGPRSTTRTSRYLVQVTENFQVGLAHVTVRRDFPGRALVRIVTLWWFY